MSNMLPLILAAGSSSRLGEPKQLLQIGGESLLNRIIRIAEDVCQNPAHVVLGAHAEKILPTIASPSAVLLQTPNWVEGMGSSLAFGARALKVRNKSVMVLLCDQIFVQRSHLAKLIAKHASHEVVATEYESGKFGVPAIFGPKHLGDLTNLRGDAGARVILLDRFAKDILGLVRNRQAKIDIDQPEDLQHLAIEIPSDSCAALIWG